MLSHQGAKVDVWRLYNVGRLGLEAVGCYHSSLPCVDPGHPQGVGQWGAGFKRSEDDEEISFADLPEAARRYLLERLED